MYKDGSMRPPTQAELESKYFPLEVIVVEWYPECVDFATVCPYNGNHEGVPRLVGHAVTHNRYPSIADLVELCQLYDIPARASLAMDGYDGELALDWRDL